MKSPALYFLLGSLLSISGTTYAANSVPEQYLDTSAGRSDQCLSSMIDRYIWVQGASAKGEGKSAAQRYQIARELYSTQKAVGFNLMLNGPWDRSLVPLLEAQTDSILDSLTGADTTGILLNGTVTANSDGLVTGLESAEKFLRANQPTKLHGIIEEAYTLFKSKPAPLTDLLKTADEQTYSDWAKNTVAISGACTQISVLQAVSCVGATSALLEEVQYNRNMILPKIWVEFVNDPKIKLGVSQAALIMIKRMRDGGSGNVFGDLKAGFVQAGFGEKDANEATWKTLALYGNGGPNTGYRLMLFELPNESSNLVVALSVIGIAVPYLEFRQIFAGQQHYAFPAEARGPCLSPKPYHFWLNAYLARWLVKQGYSAEVAQMATFIAAKGYQINRDLNNAGGGLDKILTKPTDHPTNQVIRIDLVMAASGAVYGSLVDNSTIRSFSLNQGMDRLNAVKGNPATLPKDFIQGLMSSDRIRLLYLWDKLFQPNQALKFFREQQN